ncbi:MAG TPA: XrtA-associated ATPase [Geobacteraceae bacterium]|nr:XrtA-associated ATPase [Geobacteraceae bacterium]
MYEEFFKLEKKPFELVPNPEFLFLSKSHKKAIVYLDYGITDHAGFILVTGEVGSGKTTIVRNLLKNLDDRVTLSKVFNTKVTSEQLIAMVNEDFGLDASRKDKITLLRELTDFLIEQHAVDRWPTLIIDEAQNLSAELLEEVRMLSNLETDTSKLLQIILVGQPELRKTLAQPDLRQLRQRISISCHLAPLSRQETEEYIFHRLEIAGNRNAVIFDEGTIDIIYGFSRGIPRLINIICDFLMLSAFAEETNRMTKDLVQDVIGEIELENAFWNDVTPENTFAGNRTMLFDINERLSRLEDFVSHTGISEKEKVHIHDDLAGMEKKFATFIAKSQAEWSAFDAQIKEALRELDELKLKVFENKTRESYEVVRNEPEKKRFWGKFFGYRRSLP